MKIRNNIVVNGRRSLPEAKAIRKYRLLPEMKKELGFPMSKNTHLVFCAKAGVFGISLLEYPLFSWETLFDLGIAGAFLLVVFFGLRYWNRLKNKPSNIRKLFHVKNIWNGKRQKERKRLFVAARVSREHYMPSKKAQERILEGLQELMEEQRVYRQKGITLEKLARMQGTNRTYLSSVIHKEYGQNFTWYINRHRINEAVSLLSDRNNQLPIKAISEHLGFQSLSTFYSVFNKILKTSPSHYRKLARVKKQKKEETLVMAKSEV